MAERRSSRILPKQPSYVFDEDEDNDEEDLFNDDESSDHPTENSGHDTSSEEEQDTENEADEKAVAAAAPVPVSSFYMGKDGTTKWNKTPPSTFHKRGSLNGFFPGQNLMPKVKSQLEAFELSFDRHVFERIVEFTNLYIDSVASKLRYRQTSVRPTDLLEIRALFGLLFGIGSLKGARTGLAHLWKPEDGFGWDICKCSMSFQRFKFLMR